LGSAQQARCARQRCKGPSRQRSRQLHPSNRTGFQHIGITDQPNTALNLFFLSDGVPSDGARSIDSIYTKVSQICCQFGDRLTFGAFGFAHDNGSIFEVLKNMADTAKTSGCGSKAMFSAGLDVQSLRAALTTMTTSLISTRTAMSSLAGESLLRTMPHSLEQARRVDMKKESPGGGMEDDIFNPLQYSFFMKQAPDELVRMVCSSWEKCHRRIDFTYVSLIHPNAAGIAMKKEFMEAGAERASYRLTEVDLNLLPVGRPLVGKESIREKPSQIDFHKRCARTQLEARRLAKKLIQPLRTVAFKYLQSSSLSQRFICGTLTVT
jgi:hypothetical protein